MSPYHVARDCSLPHYWHMTHRHSVEGADIGVFKTQSVIIITPFFYFILWRLPQATCNTYSQQISSNPNTINLKVPSHPANHLYFLIITILFHRSSSDENVYCLALCWWHTVVQYSIIPWQAGLDRDRSVASITLYWDSWYRLHSQQLSGSLQTQTWPDWLTEWIGKSQ